MAIRGHLDHPTPGASPRGSARRPLRLDTSAAVSSGAVQANVTVHNISAAGLLIETALALSPGDALNLDLPEAGSVTAIIVWRSETLYGCAFERTLGPAALAAAQLQGEPARAPALPEPRHTGREAVGTRINRLRREAGLTLADVAQALGVSKPTVWAWEKGKARPLPERIEAIAQVLGVPPADLAHGDGTVRETALLIEDCRTRIAAAYGVAPGAVRIMLDL